MANRLDEIMQIANAGKQLNAPTQGMQKVVNADGTVTEIPYMEDRFGRRTVMTSQGPQVLQGHEGKDPYGDLGGAIGNVLGNLINKGRLGRQERIAEKSVAEQELASPTFAGAKDYGRAPYVPTNQAELEKARERMSFEMPKEKIDYFDMSRVGSSQTSSDDLIDLGGKKYIKRTITTPKGSYFEIRDPNSGQLLQSSQTQDSETTTPNNASQTNIFASQPKVEESYGTLPNGQQVIVEKTTTGNKTQIRTLDPNTRQQIGGASKSQVPVTPQGQQSGVNPFGANPRELSQNDIDAMSLLSEDKRSKYQDPTTTDAEFRKLDLEAKTLQAKQNKLPKEATAVAEAKQTAVFLGLEGDEAKEFVRQRITGETSSSQEKVDFVLETHDLVLDMLDQNSVGAGLKSAVGSMAGRIPSMYEDSADFDNAHAKLQARLSKDNFGLMKGVLSDNDIKMLIAIGTGTLNLVGSKEAYIRELSKIRTKLENSLGKQGVKIPVREGANYHNLASSDKNEITSEGGFTIKIVE